MKALDQRGLDRPTLLFGQHCGTTRGVRYALEDRSRFAGHKSHERVLSIARANATWLRRVRTR